MKRLLHFFLCLSVLLFHSCRSTDPLDVDVSDVSINLKVERLDKALFDSPLNEMEAINKKLHERFGRFYEIYVRYILKLGTVDDPEIGLRLKEFVTNNDMRQVYEEINKKFGDFSVLKHELNDCFKHYAYYFPDHKLPEIVIYHSGFNYGVFPADSIIGIGAEMYLGPNNEIAKLLPPETHPQYLKDKMDPQYIPVDLMEAWVSNKFYSDELFGSTFLSQIVFFGKMRYLVEAMMPERSDALIMKYTDEQLRWCKENEFNIWTEIVDNKLLYSTNEREINKFTIDGPFTTGLPKESPARVGKWLGWEMVRAFMKANPNTQMEELLKRDARDVLRYYKPGK